MKTKAIQYYKENVEGVPLTQDEVIEAFCSGFLCREKEYEVNYKKQILDTLNKYRADLQQVNRFKLDKTVNQEARIRLEAKVELLIKLQNKLSKYCGYLRKAPAKVFPPSTSPLMPKTTSRIEGFSRPSATISKLCTKGTPAFIIVAS